MSSRSWQLRVRDILNAIASIQASTSNMTFEEFAANQTLVKAVLYDFIVIGEAAVSISIEIQTRFPHIPWRLMTDMQDVMAHEYFRVNLRIAWSTIQNNLPPLVPQLQAMLQQDESAD